MELQNHQFHSSHAWPIIAPCHSAAGDETMTADALIEEPEVVPPATEWPQDAIAQCVATVVRSRRATRAFKAQPLGRDIVEEILADASCAPSGANIQPWRVYVVSGAVKSELTDVLVAASRAGTAPAPEHFPEPLPDTYRARLMDFGARYYASLGIARDDTHGRTRQTERNYAFFGAPVGLIFSIDRRLKAHSWIDLGLFAQSVMIAAKARGIDTCPQVAFAQFHAPIAAHLHMSPNEVTAFGMSMGYGDPEAEVNQTRMPREPVQDFARLLGFPA
jgi:nitroreductase